MTKPADISSRYDEPRIRTALLATAGACGVPIPTPVGTQAFGTEDYRALHAAIQNERARLRTLPKAPPKRRTSYRLFSDLDFRLPAYAHELCPTPHETCSTATELTVCIREWEHGWAIGWSWRDPIDPPTKKGRARGRGAAWDMAKHVMSEWENNPRGLHFGAEPEGVRPWVKILTAACADLPSWCPVPSERAYLLAELLRTIGA